jgi:hypothetical protein
MANDVEAVRIGQSEVEENHVGRVALQPLKCFGAGLRLQDAEPLGEKAGAQEPPDRRFVVDNEDCDRLSHRRHKRLPAVTAVPGALGKQ